MSDNPKRLGDAELEIMQVIWRAGEPVTSSYILERLTQRRGWALSTLMTSLARLAEKGFVSCDRTARNNLYAATVKERDYKARESRTFLARMYGNSLQGLVTSLYDSKTIDDRDIAELRRYLDDLDKGEK